MRTAKLGDLCEFKPSKRLARIGLSENDSVSFVPMNDLGIHQKYLSAGDERPLSEVAGSYTYFADGDVLLAKITPCFENGKLGIAQGLTNGVGFGSSEFTVIRPGPNVLAEYVYYFLDRDEVRERGAKVMTGAVGHKRVPQEFVEALEISLPPLEVQRRIVAVLDEAFAAIATATANAEKNLANARELFEAVLDQSMDGTAKGWERKALGSLGRTLTGNTPKTSDADNFGDFIPFIKPGDFNADGTLRYENEGLSKIGASSSRHIASGSALMVCIGATIGKSGYAERDITSNQQVNALIPSPGVSGKFVYYQFLTAGFQAAVLGQSGQATLPIISKSKWNDLPIWLPSHDDQLAIVDELDRLLVEQLQLETLALRKIELLDNLRQSLLHRAFSGELTEREPLAA